mmetsp:Transcript_8971/g.9706  ORF Transcript_8971/g.9706 Transcript_8971/m.9706 type:complete len:264 (+) Transcript_8971:27-818(+)
MSSPGSEGTKAISLDVERLDTLTEKLHALIHQDYISDLTPSERYQVIASGFTPVFAMLLALNFAENVVLAMLLFHVVCCIMIPQLLLRKFKLAHLDLTEEFFRFEKKGMVVGTVLGVGALVMALGCYALFYDYIPNLKDNASKFDLDKYHLNALFLIGAYFVLVNPVIEEYFWRTYLYKTLAYRSERYNMFISFQYALYHLVPALNLINVGASIAGFFGLIAVGRLFAYLRVKYGVICSVILHLFGDLSIGLVFYLRVVVGWP